MEMEDPYGHPALSVMAHVSRISQQWRYQPIQIIQLVMAVLPH